ncbi:MAG: peptide chain release factor N(5)-glutamine methyltransferase [Solirubrobacteraceae bacterium]
MTARAGVSVRDALDGARTAIAAAGSSSARLDAELLLAGALGVARSRLIVEPEMTLEGEAVRTFQSHVRRRSVDREPVAYILGRRAFRRLTLSVDPRVLIPRPETELLVEVVSELPGIERVLDCATGSGAVALALKDERSDLDVTGSDISPPALAVAQANAQRLALEVSWRCADLLDGLDDTYDVIVANPPYVPSAALAKLVPEIVRHEPLLALDGGSDGLAVIRRLVSQTAATKSPALVLEHGMGQGDAVAELCHRAGFTTIERRRDLAGIERVLLAQR